MDEIDWFFYFVGKLFARGVKFIGLRLPDFSDAGYAVLGFVVVVVFTAGALALYYWRI